MMKQKKLWGVLGGFGAGIINGLLGAGGGMVVVPLLSALAAYAGSRKITAHLVTPDACESGARVGYTGTTASRLCPGEYSSMLGLTKVGTPRSSERRPYMRYCAPALICFLR